MKNTIYAALLILSNICYGQSSKENYLRLNSQDLRHITSIDVGNAKVIGFGALHGSAKTETAEILLLNELVEHNGVKYYFPETDFSTANYFQEYIRNGDEQLLEQLIYEYRKRVPQEGSIEVYNKWKELRNLFKENNVRVVGIDKIASYKFSVMELVKLMDTNHSYAEPLRLLIKSDSTDWTGYYETKTRQVLKDFVSNYEENMAAYSEIISDTAAFNHICHNLKLTFTNAGRVDTYYSNYITLANKLNMGQSRRFIRFGVFHLMKGRINNNPTLFSKLIENENYAASEVVSIQGFLTDSKVLWDAKYDKQGNYNGYTKKAGYGISDYWLEYYKDIKSLKKNRKSDITIFKLNGDKNPYSIPNDYRLVEIEMLMRKSSRNPEQNKTTLDYIDYAILIANSKAGVPIEELK